MSELTSRKLNVAGRAEVRVYEGGKGPDLLFMHGAGGLLANDPFLTRLAERFRVHAPLLPGFEDSEGAENLRDMLDITLHAYDVWEALNLDAPVLVGHSMGGMIAAEMAAIAPRMVERLVLISAAGLWLDDEPIPDLFSLLPFELPAYLFHDPERHAELLSAGGDLNDPEFLTAFLIENHRRLSLAGKILFPIPERGLSERLYRVRADTLLIWGVSDRLIPPRYADAFAELVPKVDRLLLDDAGHMVPYEQTDAVVEAITAFHN